MKSVRLSLFVYFLILLAVALGGVSWVSYRSAQEARQATETNSRLLLEARHELVLQHESTAFNEALVGRAKELVQKLDSRAVWVRHQIEPLHVLGMINGGMQQQGHLQVWLWLAESFHPWMVVRLRRPEFHLMPPEPDETPLLGEGEYYQINSFGLRPLARSENLASWMPVDDELRRRANWQGYLDSVTGPDGKVLRRVAMSWLNIGRVEKGVILPSLRPPPPPKGTAGAAGRPAVLFLYARETGARDDALAKMKETLERDKAKLQEITGTHLAELRGNLLWISGGTFLALALGGFLIIRMGLTAAAGEGR